MPSEATVGRGGLGDVKKREKKPSGRGSKSPNSQLFSRGGVAGGRQRARHRKRNASDPKSFQENEMDV